jgi:predicted membrane metal-binding protein
MSKRTLIYALSFAALGFLLALWDMELNFDPMPWAGLRYILRAACFEIPLILWFGGRLGRLLLLWPLTTAGIYAAIGCVLGRALRPQPPKVQGPGRGRLVRRFVLYFAAFGYAVAVWNDGFEVAHQVWGPVRHFLWTACLTCAYDAHPGAVGTLLFDGPINAAVFAGLGWLVGRAFRRGRTTATASKPE